jgi:hypothetical protein
VSKAGQGPTNPNKIRLMTRKALLVAGGLAALLLAQGCKPKVGGSCKLETKEVCAGDKQALVCHGGKWEEMLCRGPNGCSKGGAESSCDQSVAEDKDICNLANDFVCTSDKKGMLECNDNHWHFVQPCQGERGCTMEQKKVTCDNSIAKVDDPCRDEDDYGCTADGKIALVCKSQKFTVASNCKGPNGCKVVADKDKEKSFKVECDDSISAIGDPCEKEGHFTCAADNKSILKCKDKKFAQDDKCRGREKCAVKGEMVGCY